MFELLEWLGNCYALYRAGQDGGMWFLSLDAPVFQNFMESHLIAKGKM